MPVQSHGFDDMFAQDIDIGLDERCWKWVGILGAGESLFEGCAYINLIIYWNRKMKTDHGGDSNP